MLELMLIAVSYSLSGHIPLRGETLLRFNRWDRYAWDAEC
jgi:hypothetical protein